MVDQRVVDYIKENLLRGVSLEQIKRALINVGWPQEEINNAIDFINQGTKPVDFIAKDYKKNISCSKKIILIGIAIVIIFCLILGFFLYPREISFEKEFSLGDLQMESMSLSPGGGPTIEGRYISLVSIGENDEITIEVDGVSETIEHSSKKVINGVEIENVEIEDNGLAKIKIKIIEPKNEDDNNNKKISQEDNNKVDEIDCNEDFDCFVDASEDCNPAKLKHSLTLNLFGVEQTTSKTYKILGTESDKCIFFLRTDSIDLNFPEDAEVSQEAIDEQKEMYDALEDREGTCKFETKDLTDMLKRWKQGNFDSGEISCGFKSDGKTECTTKGGDFGVAECQGTYFIIDLCIDDGKCPPGCSAETDNDC
ncbi:MAG: hypothetical protein KKE93_00950 [Nanoarchaeota archaeon]|nr:hypothetical protein [Nanoarchaeota archaeon]